MKQWRRNGKSTEAMTTTMMVIMVTKQHWDRLHIQARIKVSSTAHTIITPHGDTTHLISPKDMHVTIFTSAAIGDKWVMMRTPDVVGTGLRTLTSNVHGESIFPRTVKKQARPMLIARYWFN